MAVRRTELAQFLRSRRERIGPEDVGLPPGPRRRTPGLRREEVAQLAGVGVTWYTWLEQGRPINASTQILDAVARTLRLDPTERGHLYRLAEIPAVPEYRGEADPLPDGVQAVLDQLNPLPASVYNGRFDLLAWNDGYAAVLPALVTQPPSRRNGLWVLFGMPGCCSGLVNWAQEAPRMVATLRANFARHLDDPVWTGLIGWLCAESPEFAGLWAAHDVATPGERLKVFQTGTGGPVRTRSISFALSSSPEVRMITYTPIDEQSWGNLNQLLETPVPDRFCRLHGSGTTAEAATSVVG
jgi:transcriptional regulator with XRE-family HTH domain